MTTSPTQLLNLALFASMAGCAAGAGTAPPSPYRPLTVGLGERARIGAVALTPLRIEEDSRCPASVQCIQAGTVRVAVRLDDARGRSSAVLTLDRSFRLRDGDSIVLTEVRPYPERPGPIPRSSYRLTFRRALPAPIPTLQPAPGG